MADKRDVGALREAAAALRVSQAQAARNALRAAEPDAALTVRVAALLLECEEELDELEAVSDRVHELVDQAWGLLGGATIAGATAYRWKGPVGASCSHRAQGRQVGVRLLWHAACLR